MLEVELNCVCPVTVVRRLFNSVVEKKLCHQWLSSVSIVRLVVVLLSSIGGALHADGIASRVSEPLNELIVRVDSALWGRPDQVIDLISHRDAAVLARMGGPTAARYLVTLRILPKFLTQMDTREPRVGLHEAFVLSYSNAQETDAAEALLRGAAGVKSIDRDRISGFSSPPNDPLLTPTFDVREYQWAADRLRLFQAWEKVRGTTYASILDNGIQIHGLDPLHPATHPDLIGNYRAQFSRNLYLYNGPNGTANTADNLDEEPYTVGTVSNIAGHGSHTAGILAATGNNGIGVAGVCQYCALILGRISVWFGPPYSQLG